MEDIGIHGDSVESDFPWCLLGSGYWEAGVPTAGLGSKVSAPAQCPKLLRSLTHGEDPHELTVEQGARTRQQNQ